MGLLFPSIRFLKIVVDPSSLCCGEKQFQGVIHPAWKRYSVNPVLAVPGSLDSNGTQTLNSRFPGEGGTNPIPGGRFVLQSVMDVSEILSLTSSRARGGGCGKVRGYLRTMLWDTEGPPGIREGQSPICALYIPGASLGSGIIWILRPRPPQRMPCRCVSPSETTPVAANTKYIANIFILMPIIAWLPTSRWCCGETLPPGVSFLWKAQFTLLLVLIKLLLHENQRAFLGRKGPFFPVGWRNSLP